MTRKPSCATLAALLMATAIGASAQSVSKPFVYPADGQSPDQQSKDDIECLGFAQQQTGFDPSRGPQVAETTDTSGRTLGGAALGAALGALGGAIAGSAGKGAAIGAGVGAAGGTLSKQQTRSEEQQRQAAHNQDYNQRLSDYYRAYGACMKGRGYSVN